MILTLVCSFSLNTLWASLKHSWNFFETVWNTLDGSLKLHLTLFDTLWLLTFQINYKLQRHQIAKGCQWTNGQTELPFHFMSCSSQLKKTDMRLSNNFCPFLSPHQQDQWSECTITDQINTHNYNGPETILLDSLDNLPPIPTTSHKKLCNILLY